LLEGFELQTLAPHHQRESFHCRANSLNDFLHKQAKNQHRNDTTRVYVYANRAGVIAGFFTLSASLLEVTDLPQSILKGRPRLPIPATLLGRFAVAQNHEGQGLGTKLLSYALREAYKSSQIVAAAFVVLDVAKDASPRASDLYRKYGFEPLPPKPERMVLLMSAVARSMLPTTS
jgi:GNAT superfamily N-acetyltransferase